MALPRGLAGAPTGPQPRLPLLWTRPRSYECFASGSSGSRLKPPSRTRRGTPHREAADDVGGGGHRGPPRLGGGVGRDDAVGELFGGHKLACDYDSDNPFERKRGLQLRTSHYAPAAAGDTVHAELHRKLGAANQREVCTLLPSLSYMYDLHTHLERLEVAIGDERDDPGDARRALRLVHEQAAEFDPLYGNERSQSGARSLLGQRLHESRVSRRHTRLGSAVASADSARLKPKPPGASKRVGRLGGGGGGDGGGGGHDSSGSSRRGGGDSGGSGGGGGNGSSGDRRSGDGGGSGQRGGGQRDGDARGQRDGGVSGRGGGGRGGGRGGGLKTHRDRVRSRLSAWRDIGASRQTLRWLGEGVRVPWNERGPPLPLHHGVGSFSPDERAWLTLERDRCLGTGAWRRATRCDYVSRAFVVWHKGKPRLVIDLRWVNEHVEKRSCKFESLATLRRLARLHDFMFSLDLTDAYHHIGVHESDVDYFTFAVETEAGVEYFSPPRSTSAGLSLRGSSPRLRDVVRYLRNPDAAARPRYGQRRRHSGVHRGVRTLPWLDDFAFFVRGVRADHPEYGAMLEAARAESMRASVAKSCMPPKALSRFAERGAG
ncbi:hypothetical protein EMIHUDRAFT_101419 [Emiliania huxleyi CCMP1516]|uniref:Reverse transcriptase domain-containing protein n=2 Tax=Emiliania huxleyi TaxID=2903 RepID=A0A0D3JFJ6_EMIH1|nr:hypothetical protein EMIHUDRAFT_101419 [Emiliania huxleyi CCMP1516]EOD22281.1 hypothetical protein EMIHUDRAFT_101419 [Emiliania huxleyi CCMP1516]|eukprot:XP_005774710.1 hypothetical protein EMIHUDRAFT_101419 [Emiliania huxleyi CCMP1516]